MKQNREWTDTVRDAFRDAEAAPPADGWARLERELGSIPASRVPVWRVYRMRIAAAAALAACVATGGYLWHAMPDSAGFEAPVVASAVGGGQPVTEQPAALLAENTAGPVREPLTAVAASNAGVSKSRSEVRIAADDADAIPMSVGAAGDADGVQAQVTEGTGGALQNHSGEGVAQSRSRAATRSSAQVSADQQARTLRGNDFVAQKLPRKKTSFSLHAGGVVTGRNSAVGSIGLLMADVSNALPDDGFSMQPQNRYEYPQSSFRHHQPLSFGVSVSKGFAYGLSLESGVNYTLLRSEVDLTHGTESISQKLHFIGVPLRLNWQFLERGRFSLYIGAGGMIEKCVVAKFGTKSVAEPGVQWSVLGAAGAQYRLGGVVGLYFEPEMSYYFTNTNLRTSRSDSPLTLTLRLGVRLSF